MIVNGADEFVGSDVGKLNAAVSNNLQKDKGSDISITTTKNGNDVTVAYDINEPGVVLLNIALVEPEATSSIKRGENRGATLHHVNITRKLLTVDAKGKGTVLINIPTELSGIPLELIAFTQSKNDLSILGADKKQNL